MPEALTPLNPQRTVLLVMDYQPGILSNFAQADELLTRVSLALSTAREAGIHIGYVHVAFSDEDYAAIPPTNKMFAALAGRGNYNHKDSPESAIHERLAPQPNDIIVRKTRVGAFSTTDLEAELRSRQVNTLILAGVSTSGVVLSTLRDAADHDYRLLVLSDGCADRDPEVHDVLMNKVFPRQADVITIDDLSQLLPES